MIMRKNKTATLVGLCLLLFALACGPARTGTFPTISAGITPTTTLGTEIAPNAETQAAMVFTATPPLPPPPAAITFEQSCGSGTAALPAAAPRFAEFAQTVLATLNAGSSPALVEQGLRAWGSVTDQVGKVWAADDLTGDGKPDLLVIAQAPQDQFPDFTYPGPDGLPSLPGDLYVYSCAEPLKISLAYADYSTPDRITPRLTSILDINADQVTDLAYTTQNCGAHTCFIQLHVIEWNAAANKFGDIFTVEAQPNGKYDITDTDADGVQEIIVHIGRIGSAGAGIQRTYDETYEWNGTIYSLKSRTLTSPEFPIHHINDADTALEAQDYAKAIGLYLQVINDPAPKTFLAQDETPALKAYARYRLMLAYILVGDQAKAQATYNELAGLFTNTPAEAPGAGFARFADLFWVAYGKTSSVKTGCAEVVALATNNEATYRILNEFGYANRFYKPEDMCPFGG